MKGLERNKGKDQSSMVSSGGGWVPGLSCSGQEWPGYGELLGPGMARVRGFASRSIYGRLTNGCEKV